VMKNKNSTCSKVLHVVEGQGQLFPAPAVTDMKINDSHLLSVSYRNTSQQCKNLDVLYKF